MCPTGSAGGPEHCGQSEQGSRGDRARFGRGSHASTARDDGGYGMP